MQMKEVVSAILLQILIAGHGMAQTLDVERLHERAHSGDISSQRDLGQHYQPIDPKLAYKYYEMCANQGDAFCIGKIGYLSIGGRAVPRDYARGLRLLEEAAAQCDVLALHNLGSFYGKYGIMKDYKKAYMYFNICAAFDEGQALGDCARQRDGLESVMNTEAILNAQTEARDWLEENPCKVEQ
jgi:TPR repeat protein